MSSPELKFELDEYGRIVYRVTDEGVLLSKDEKEFIIDHVTRMQAENAKLRELVRDMGDAIVDWYDLMDGAFACESVYEDEKFAPLFDRMRELGVEA